MKPTLPNLVTLLSLTLLAGGALAQNQNIQGNLQVDLQSTFVGDVLMKSVVEIGQLHSTSTAGFKMKVSQATTDVEREDVIPGHYDIQTVYEDVFGEIQTCTGQVWVEDYGYTVGTTVWVQEYGNIFVGQQTVIDYGTEEYQHEVSPAVYDEITNELITAAVTETRTRSVVIGTHEEDIYEWGVTGGHYETLPGSWGVVGGHWEDQFQSGWGVVGSTPVTTEVWVPEQHTTYTETVHGLPIVEFTGQTDEVVWSWKNLERPLLELGTGGLKLPYPNDAVNSHRTVLTSTQLEQSYTSPGSIGPYSSYGTIVAKHEIKAWNDEGQDDLVTSSVEAKLVPGELKLTQTAPDPVEATTTTKITRIGVTNSTFAGNVTVQGILRVRPAGDVGMGPFTNGPQP